MDPVARSLRARIAAATFAATHDMAAVAAHAREAKWLKLLDQVDPNHELPEAERIRRAKALRKAQMAQLSLAAHQARIAKRGGQARSTGGQSGRKTESRNQEVTN